MRRFKHENAEVVVNADGRIVIYMGDDERGEFLYRYVSDGYYAEGGDTDELMEIGTLYAAKFDADGTGTWLALTPETTGMEQAMICIHTRLAASSLGATTMDRPEWVTANPLKAEVYCALTNNKNRGVKPNAGGDETPVGGPNPREANKIWTDRSMVAQRGRSYGRYIYLGSFCYGGKSQPSQRCKGRIGEC